MQLSKKQRELVEKKLKELGSVHCPACGNKKVIVNDRLFELREFEGGSLVIGGAALIPVLAATCNKCGHILFFNALAMGLVKPEPSSDERQDKQ